MSDLQAMAILSHVITNLFLTLASAYFFVRANNRLERIAALILAALASMAGDITSIRNEVIQ